MQPNLRRSFPALAVSAMLLGGTVPAYAADSTPTDPSVTFVMESTPSDGTPSDEPTTASAEPAAVSEPAPEPKATSTTSSTESVAPAQAPGPEPVAAEQNAPAEAPAEDVYVDSDSDGLMDPDEIANGTDPNNPDTDGDGVRDLDEYSLGTNPLVADSDGDGTPDGSDPNPTDPDSTTPPTGTPPVAAPDNFDLGVMLPEGDNRRDLDFMANDTLNGAATFAVVEPFAHNAFGQDITSYAPVDGVRGAVTDTATYRLQNANGSSETVTITVEYVALSYADDVWRGDIAPRQFWNGGPNHQSFDPTAYAHRDSGTGDLADRIAGATLVSEVGPNLDTSNPGAWGYTSNEAEEQGGRLIWHNADAEIVAIADLRVYDCAAGKAPEPLQEPIEIWAPAGAIERYDAQVINPMGLSCGAGYFAPGDDVWVGADPSVSTWAYVRTPETDIGTLGTGSQRGVSGLLGDVVFTPDTGVVGTREVTIEICDGNPVESCRPVRLILHTTGKPTAEDEEAETRWDVPKAVDVAANDEVAEMPRPSTMEITDVPEGITARITDRGVIEVKAPDATWVGKAAAVRYRHIDYSGESAGAVLSVRFTGDEPTPESTCEETGTCPVPDDEQDCNTDNSCPNDDRPEQSCEDATEDDCQDLPNAGGAPLWVLLTGGTSLLAGAALLVASRRRRVPQA